jgi:hypothetical protein
LTLALLTLELLTLAVLSLAVFVTRVAAPLAVLLDFAAGFLGVTFFCGIPVHLLPTWSGKCFTADILVPPTFHVGVGRHR